MQTISLHPSADNLKQLQEGSWDDVTWLVGPLAQRGRLLSSPLLGALLRVVPPGLTY